MTTRRLIANFSCYSRHVCMREEKDEEAAKLRAMGLTSDNLVITIGRCSINTHTHTGQTFTHQTTPKTRTGTQRNWKVVSSSN